MRRLVVFLSIIALSGFTFAQKTTTQPVVVTNTSTNPVPVTGSVTVTNAPTAPLGVSGTVSIGNTPSVTITNTPTVSATIIGTPTVALSGTPSVAATISGTPSVNATINGTPSVTLSGAPDVRDADNPARHAVRHSASMQAPSGELGGQDASPYVVPDGKRLVIDTISGDTQTDADGGKAFVGITIGGAGTYRLWVPQTVTVTDGLLRTHTFGTERVQAYADALMTVTCFFNRYNSANNGYASGIAYVNCEWHGHLVDLP